MASATAEAQDEATNPFAADALDGLCSKDQLELLDSIDCLRSQGISHYVSLPQIIVCGDQSSGKSSVLEAISGVSFPIKSNLCTRFPTELVLRKTSHIGVTVSIVPHQSRSEAEQLALGSFHEKLDGFDELPTLIENAKAAMAISTHGRAFSKDLLRIEVSGPDRPHLTIVDLPGLIHSETKQQSASDVELVQDVVQAYMKEPRSIILAVVSAKNDYANQIVLKLARAADRKGTRTLGVITKPDTLIAGSESEAMYVSLARNQDVEFRLGWHVLKNMDSETGQWSLADRDLKEEEFFSQGIWEELSRPLLGIDKLRKRLSKVLLGQIAAELPSLINEIEIKSDACRSRLDKLGKPRATLDEQRLYLLHISQSFQSLIKASVDGTYNDPFFEDANSEPGYRKRIRAVVQNLNLEFAEHIARQGHRRQITDPVGQTHVPKGVTPTTRDEFMDHIQHLMRRTRGRELPGTFNPMIVADLFLEQSTPWEAITQKYVGKVWKATKEYLSLTTTYVADAATSKALFQKIFEPALNQLLEALKAKTAELLMPHQTSHPITYNHYFTDTLQKVRNERKEDEYSRIVKDFFGVSALGSVYIQQTKDLRQLVVSLVQRRLFSLCSIQTLTAMKLVANSVGVLEQVALKRFVDDIAIEVIEAKLISPLQNIFSLITVTSMPADLVTGIAGESEENRAEREQLTKQLEVLMKGSETCKHFVGVRVLGVDDGTIQVVHQFKSANCDSSDSDEESDDGSDLPQEDVRTLSERSYGCRSPPSREVVESKEELEETPKEPEEAPKEPEDEESPYYSKKKSKKSKFAARRSFFEQE
ncbi:related to vacuolar sorting protein VPS1, dynamin, and related proteins [Phialocephala subalpina]|uniref:Related to vacuolar sorting protein VPS1, dynamin, and related proteins n=1 Tax=Phialocephala subalpina TaxID=576137 RepID=A0A1L7WIE2_9HELO|nr:related to vacuolar sorting protein VPS1, dynamin, and related proteins [Phialocephala subalpina]